MPAHARTEMLGVRFTIREYAALEERAKADGGKNLSRWARNVLLDELKPRKRVWKERERGAVEQMPAKDLRTTVTDGQPYYPIPIVEVWPQPKPGVGVSIEFKPLRSWAQEWAMLAELDPKEAASRLHVLLNGTRLPEGFMQFTHSERIDWLERMVPLT